MPAVPTRILPTIVLSQFAATSLWFAGNAVMPDLQRSAGLPASDVGDITIAVQLGFIAGTGLRLARDRRPLFAAYRLLPVHARRCGGQCRDLGERG